MQCAAGDGRAASSAAMPMGCKEALLALGPQAPLGEAGARGLVRSALALDAPRVRSRSFEGLAGGASGEVFFPGEGDGTQDGPAPAFGPDRPHVVAIGAFDGVHRGHRELLRRARLEAEARGCALAAVTFDPDPADVLEGPAASSALLCREDRLAQLTVGEGRPDAVAFVGFTRELAALGYREFVEGVLGALFDVRAIVVGSDFRLGSRGAGDVCALSALGRGDGFDVVGVELMREGEAAVTATRARGLIREGRVEEAAGLLGRCHFARGRIEHGRGEGTGFGFPTANVLVDGRFCLPEQGVYAGFVVPGARLRAGSAEACEPAEPLRAWPAAVNVGRPPTFAGEGGAGEGGLGAVDSASAAPTAPTCAPTLLEANLIGFEGDLYGRDAAVVLVRWLRDSRPFDSLEELERTVLGNIDWAAQALGGGGIVL